MTDNFDHADHEETWLTPKQIEQQYNVRQRQVYRWIERNQVTARRVAGQTQVSQSSVEAFMAGRVVSERVSQVSSVIDSPSGQNGQSTGPTRGELKNTVAIQVLALQQERDKLIEQIRDLNAARVSDARQLGGLEEKARRLEQLEGEINRLQTANNRLLIGAALVILLLVLAVVLLALVR